MIKIGSSFEATVKDLASDGRGVVTHPQGRTFFVPGVWLDEQGTFRVTGLKGRIGFAEALALEPASLHPSRVTPACPHHGNAKTRCGGCPWQFIEYSQQVEAKQQRVYKAMARLGVEQALRNIVPAPEPLAYRNRAQFKSDGAALGYMASNSNHLVAIEYCPVLTEKNQLTLQTLLGKMPRDEWKPSRRKRWTSIDIDENTGADAASINVRLPFQQANSAQNDYMKQWLAGVLSSCSAERAVELFCGSGNLTEVLAASAVKDIVAVEVVDAALQKLREKKLAAVKTLKCNLFDTQGFTTVSPHLKQAELLLLDPPRDGLLVRSPLFERKSKLREVIYISCDLSTFTRDLRDFIDHGYELVELQPLDMFPQTPHIELLAFIKK